MSLQLVKETRKFEEIYQILRILGEGSFGKVYLCKRQPDGVEVAVKEVIIPQYRNTDLILKNTLTEIDIASKEICVSNPCNIAKIYRTFYRGEYEVFYIEMEVITGGNANNYVEFLTNLQSEGENKLAESSLISNFYEAISTLLSIHKQCVLHRDIKPDNLLFDEKKGKLIFTDFGISCFMKDCEGMAGTQGYIDPRAFFQFQQLDEWSDIYSLCVVFYEILTKQRYQTRYLLFNEYATFYENAYRNLLNRRERVSIDSELYVLIEAVLGGMNPIDEKERYSLHSIIQALEAKNPRLLHHGDNVCQETRKDKSQKKAPSSERDLSSETKVILRELKEEHDELELDFNRLELMGEIEERLKFDKPLLDYIEKQPAVYALYLDS